ncbi:MAG: carboxypeptidase regulatory-like domain-containing protein, partial [Deltaproteobacteria bacterium]|nr:carboxypeptidase regulatory-like domain-containing protein [Deltaproteobacteria bacterium]
MNKRIGSIGAALAAVVIALLVWRCRGSSERDTTPATGSGSAEVTQTGPRPVSSTKPLPDPTKLSRGSIAGTITIDGTKAPLPGARVCANGESRDYPSEVLRVPSCVTSDANGAYVITGLLPAEYALLASAKTYRPEVFHPDGNKHRSSFPLRAGEAKTGIDLALRTGGVELKGTVSDLTGGPIAKAMVWTSDPIVVAETDDKGAFSVWVSRGHTAVHASADGYADNREYLYAPGKVELLLTPESTLSGTVVDARTSQPVEGARVTLGDWSEAETTFSDAEGKFRLDRINPGRQTITARTDRGYGRTEGSELVGLGQHVDGVVVKLFPAARIEARIMIAGELKRPCETPRASLHDAAAQRWIQLKKEPDGLLWADGVLPGDYKPQIACEGYQTREKYDHIVVSTDDAKDIVWEVDAGAVIKGKVTTKSGEPVEDAELWARSLGGGARAKTGWGGDRTGRDGSYELTGLKPGTYRIEAATTKGIAPKDGYKVEVASGATVVKDLVLDDGGTLTGTVVDANGAPVGGIEVNTRLLTGGSRSWGGDRSTDDNGSFTIEGMRPGDYRVLAQRGWSDTLRKPGTTDDAKQGERVTVRANQVATVKLVVEAQSGIIKGTVVDTDGSPVGDAFVSAARESDAAGAQRTNVLDTRWSWQDKPVLTGTDGTFTLTKLSPGTYTLRAYRKGGGEAIAEHIEVGSNAVLQIKPTGSIEGIATGPGGPPDELSISLQDPKSGLWRSEDFYRTDGRFAIRDLPKGHFRITAESAGITKQIELDLAEGERKTGVTIQLEKLIKLTGKVVDSVTQKPVPGVHMHASTAESGGGFSFSSGDEENVTDDSGAFTIARAPRGKILLRGVPKDFRDSEYATLSVIRTVSADSTTADVGAIPIIKKRVKQGDPVGELGVNFAEQPPDTPPDKHEYKISWIDPAGPSAKTGLQVGDVITTIDGTDVAGAAAGAGWVLMRAAPGTKIA